MSTQRLLQGRDREISSLRVARKFCNITAHSVISLELANTSVVIAVDLLMVV
jgi:hypothetical protein